MTDPTPVVCLPPTPPVMECHTTRIYGAPIGRPGRMANNVAIPIAGIAVHCIGDTYDSFLSKACTGRGTLAPYGHASFHYIIDNESGRVSTLVDETNMAWSFQSYLSNFPVITPTGYPPCPPDNCPVDPCATPPYPAPDPPYPGWTVLSALYPNISADFYTINIGIASPDRSPDLDGCEICAGPYGMSWRAYETLVRLTAWISYRYNIQTDRQHIAFHDDIVDRVIGCQECPCWEDTHVCFHCDVSDYCEECKNTGDPTFVRAEDIFWFYGESSSGCKVRVRLDFVKEILGIE